jgi:hypothetical protein
LPFGFRPFVFLLSVCFKDVSHLRSPQFPLPLSAPFSQVSSVAAGLPERAAFSRLLLAFIQQNTKFSNIYCTDCNFVS